LNFLFEQLVKCQSVGLRALKQRLNQNRWLLPLCWCSSDYTFRSVFTRSGICIPETTFLTPFVDFQRGDLHCSDYTIRKLLELSGLCNPNPFIQHWHQHPSGWFECQNPRICPEFLFWNVFGLYVPDQGYFWREKIGRARKGIGWEK